MERCWEILERHWNGAVLVDARTMLEWDKSMTWTGLHPVVEVSLQVYATGISLSKVAMTDIEARLQRHSGLPNWDILI
jgi:hypothetical protein